MVDLHFFKRVGCFSSSTCTGKLFFSKWGRRGDLASRFYVTIIFPTKAGRSLSFARLRCAVAPMRCRCVWPLLPPFLFPLSFFLFSSSPLLSPLSPSLRRLRATRVGAHTRRLWHLRAYIYSVPAHQPLSPITRRLRHTKHHPDPNAILDDFQRFPH